MSYLGSPYSSAYLQDDYEFDDDRYDDEDDRENDEPQDESDEGKRHFFFIYIVLN